MRKLLTPGMTVVVAAVAGSAMPLATGSMPPTLTATLPVASPQQMSNAPEQSAKLITIEGVPAVNWAGAGNRPSVNWVNLSSVAISERESAAYNTLQAPVARLTTLP